MQQNFAAWGLTRRLQRQDQLLGNDIFSPWSARAFQRRQAWRQQLFGSERRMFRDALLSEAWDTEEDDAVARDLFMGQLLGDSSSHDEPLDFLLSEHHDATAADQVLLELTGMGDLGLDSKDAMVGLEAPVAPLPTMLVEVPEAEGPLSVLAANSLGPIPADGEAPLRPTGLAAPLSRDNVVPARVEVHVLPEPHTFSLWSLLAAGAFAFGRGRRERRP